MIVRLSQLIPVGDEPPCEFRICKAGANETQKGTFLFDAEAARSVMAAYERDGVDLLIDLEHESLEKGPGKRSDQKDARGWAKLELREDGSLWAVDVRWTPDGERRLREKTQRYISPVFLHDDQRIREIFHCALVGQPATYHAPPLVAASRVFDTRDHAATFLSAMDPKLVQEALDALIAGDSAKCAEILQGLVVSAASGGAAPPAPSGGGEPTAESADAPVAKELCRVLEVATTAEAFAKIGELVKLSDQRAAERAALESGQRLELVAELVKLGAETPATAWEGDPAVKRVPVARLAAEPVASLRDRVTSLRARGPAGPAVVVPPADPPAGLSERELAMLAKMKPEEQARFKALRASHKI